MIKLIIAHDNKEIISNFFQHICIIFHILLFSLIKVTSQMNNNNTQNEHLFRNVRLGSSKDVNIWDVKVQKAHITVLSLDVYCKNVNIYKKMSLTKFTT